MTLSGRHGKVTEKGKHREFRKERQEVVVRGNLDKEKVKRSRSERNEHTGCAAEERISSGPTHEHADQQARMTVEGGPWD